MSTSHSICLLHTCRSLAICVVGLGHSHIQSGQIKVVIRNGACVVITDCTADIDFATNTAKLCYGDLVANGVGYGLQVLSMNHIETFSALPNIFFAAGIANYNFKTAPGQAFGANQTPGPPSCFFGGDENRDGTVDVSDIVDVYNDAAAFAGGCRLRTDINSDEFVDVTDLILTYNNAVMIVSVIAPCPEPLNVIENNESYSSSVLTHTKLFNREKFNY